MRYCLTVGRAVLLEQPLSADAAADAPLLAHSAVQIEVQGQVFACIQLVACFHDGAVALQGGSGSAIAVDGCLSVAAKFILPCQACVSLALFGQGGSITTTDAQTMGVHSVKVNFFAGSNGNVGAIGVGEVVATVNINGSLVAYCQFLAAAQAEAVIGGAFVVGGGGAVVIFYLTVVL